MSAESPEPDAPAEPDAPVRTGKRRRRLVWGGAGVVVIAAAAGITVATVGSGSAAAGSPGGLNLVSASTLGQLQPAPTPGPAGYESVPVPDVAPLASTATMATGQQVDGISCNKTEHTLFHWHAHLTIFVNGVQRQVPAGIGIPGAKEIKDSQGLPYIKDGTCFYWMHTHAPDGVIHIESPIKRSYTLGDLFDEWGQSLSAGQVGSAKGHVTVLYNGKVYRGNPRDLPVVEHTQIQLEVGTPLVSQTLLTGKWPAGPAT